MTLQLLHSEIPYIWGKIDFLFYQLTANLSAANFFLAFPAWKSCKELAALIIMQEEFGLELEAGIQSPEEKYLSLGPNIYGLVKTIYATYTYYTTNSQVRASNIH